MYISKQVHNYTYSCQTMVLQWKVSGSLSPEIQVQEMCHHSQSSHKQNPRNQTAGGE